MASAGTVTVDFAAETARFTAELKQVNARLKTIEGGFKSLEKVAKTAVSFLSAGLLTSFVKSAADAADQLGKTSDKLGLSTQRLKAFQIAAEDAGVSFEATNKVLIDSQKRLGEAALGTGEAAKFIKLLGLNIADLQKLSPDELFKVYSDSINNLSNRSEQLAAATALMGKSAAQAFGLIQAGSPAIDEAAEFVDRFALALDRVSIKQIEQANDSLTRLQLISRGGFEQFVSGLAPFVEEFSRRIQEATGSTQALATAGGVAGATIQTALDLATNAANLAKAAFFGLAGAIAETLAGLVEFAVKAHTLLNTGSFFFTPQVQEQLAIAVDNATASLKASADVNLSKARESLDAIKSIKEIQDGIVAALESSRQRAEQALAEQAAREAAAKAGGASLASPIGLDLQEQFDISNEAARVAAEEQKRIARELTGVIFEEVEKRNEAERDAAAFRLELNLRAEQAIVDAKATTANLAVGFLQTLGAKNKAFAIAAIVLEKAIAIQRLLFQNRIAAELAFASQLIPGVPATLATATAAKAAVLTQGVLSAGLIAATGALQIADVTSGGGRAPIGSPLNPAFVATSPGAGSQELGATSQSAIQVIIANNVGFDQRVMDQIIAGLREATDGRDVIIFGPESRQAQELVGG